MSKSQAAETRVCAGTWAPTVTALRRRREAARPGRLWGEPTRAQPQRVGGRPDGHCGRLTCTGGQPSRHSERGALAGRQRQVGGMPPHKQLRVGGGHPLEGGRPALPAIRHDEVVGVQGKMLQILSVLLIGDDHRIPPLLAQIVAAMQASATPAVGFHPHHRSSN